MAKVAIREGFHSETRMVSQLTSQVAATKDGWTRGENLSVPGVTAISEIYADLSAVIALYGGLVQKDVAEFDVFGVSIEVQDREAAKSCEGP